MTTTTIITVVKQKGDEEQGDRPRVLSTNHTRIRIEKIFAECSARDSEPKFRLTVQGPTIKAILDKRSLKEYKREVSDFFSELYWVFQTLNGGSLEDIFKDHTGKPWTGFQRRAEKLAILGIALGIIIPVKPGDTLHIFTQSTRFIIKENFLDTIVQKNA